MSLDGGLGGVTADKNILLETSITEKIAGCPHQNGIDRWIVVHRWNSDEFNAYLLTSAGLDTVPVVSAVDKWSATLDGKWITELRAEDQVLTHTFDKFSEGKGKRSLVVEVTDERGNRKSASYTFER
ncbi:MAG: hypothetical protein IPG10_19855 [Flavobacteriales bacterium]|nr:hypothetical protein [Flavobacteriales bacterium]